jgi:hypothetical protein
MMRRQLAELFGALVAVVSLACGEYARTNPYDPNIPVEIDITGPDTIFSYAGLAQYSARSIPAFPDTAVQWGSSDSIALPPAGPGTFKALSTPLYPATVTILVSALIGHVDTTKTIFPKQFPVIVPDIVWRHKTNKDVVLTQRVVRIQLRCPDTHACDPLSAGGQWSVWVDGFDALGHQIVALTSATANPATGTPIATFVSRDTTIASVSPVGIRAVTVTARKAGTTWIVATRGTLLDSLSLVVQ